MFHIRYFGNHFNQLFSVILLSLSLSFLLIQDVSIMKSKLRILKNDLILQFVQPQPLNTLDDDILMSNMWEVCQFTSPFDLLWDCLNHRIKRELTGCTRNVTIIPWTKTVQHGSSLAPLNNISVQDGYFMMHGQVLFLNPNVVMGYVITHRTRGVDGKGQRITRLLHCLQEMPEDHSANTCYTTGKAKLDCQDELDLVVPDRSKMEIAMHTESIQAILSKTDTKERCFQ
ncbi:uncharacterized protein LOC143526574 [Brachyhypopomus gauderio]|uniref:uncharacterized protein LOC143526574 n=1 Tax=Brachyhypopomus gauderio TaxID=698409 RepID=UPI0040431E99